jgi:hypothetical protein
MSKCEHRIPLAHHPDTGCMDCDESLYDVACYHIARAEKAEARIKELEATLKTLASQAMYALKKGDWKNESKVTP